MQSRTYAGLLCGLPDSDMTARRVNDLIEKGRAMGFGEPCLIQPVVTRRDASRNGEVRIEERLPPVACLACFDSGEIPSSDEPCSSLVVAWFQQRFGDVDEEIVPQLIPLEWDLLAMAWCP
jgi:hypothetical protein